MKCSVSQAERLYNIKRDFELILSCKTFLIWRKDKFPELDEIQMMIAINELDEVIARADKKEHWEIIKIWFEADGEKKLINRLITNSQIYAGKQIDRGSTS